MIPDPNLNPNSNPDSTPNLRKLKKQLKNSEKGGEVFDALAGAEAGQPINLIGVDDEIFEEDFWNSHLNFDATDFVVVDCEAAMSDDKRREVLKAEVDATVAERDVAIVNAEHATTIAEELAEELAGAT